MVFFLIRALIFLASSAVGLLVASQVVNGFSVKASGFAITVTVFAVIQSVLAPFIGMVAKRHANALLGGVGIVATFLALLVAQTLSSGLQITGASAWALSTFVVWLATAVATMLLPLVMFRKAVQKRRAS